ncbi:MAG: MOSC domain-containing protein [Rhodothermales bacterium]
MVTVSSLHIYPVKSTAGVPAQAHRVEKRGLALDRRWAIFGASGQVITAREIPKILGLQVRMDGAHAMLYALGQSESFELTAPADGTIHQVAVFKNQTAGVEVSAALNDWLSAYLGTPCTLLYMSDAVERPVLEKNGGGAHDIVSYADQCPILLVSEATLDDLNSRLDDAVTMQRFRPNIVVKGCDASAEDTWKKIKIGAVTYTVSQLCQRCVFTTIDPQTFTHHKRQEPLRTLATYRPHPDGGVAFGVHLIPLEEGVIQAGDAVEVLNIEHPTRNFQ